MAKLFWSRLVLYALTVTVPLYYPAVVLAYDRLGLITWFGYVPLMLGLAFFMRPPRVGLRATLLTPLVVAGVFSLYAGWSRDGAMLALAGLGAWLLTALIFMGGYRGVALAAVEMFALGAVYYRLLTFARASEDVARAASGWLVPLTVLAVAAFLLHGLVLYLSAFPERSTGRRRRELLIFGAAAIPLALALLFLLPTDFVRNDLVLNRFLDEPKLRELPNPTREGDNDRGGPSQGDSDDENKNGLPLGGRNTTQPRPSPGAGNQNEGDTPIREFRPDEHRSSPGISPHDNRGVTPGGGSSGKPREPAESREGKSRKKEQGKSPKQGGNEPGNKASGEGGKSGGKKREPKQEEPSGQSGGKGEKSGKGASGGGPKEGPQGGNESGQKKEGPKNESGKSQKQEKSEGKSGQPQKRENRLRGAPAENYKPKWTNETQQSDGDSGHQYALMVIASPVEPVYSAESYWNDFDRDLGFQIQPADFYNQIGHSRLLETWKNPRSVPDEKRAPVNILYFSAVPQRVLPYFPEIIEPTKLSVRYRPFDLSYRARALMSTSGPEDWKKVPELTRTERKDLARFLKADLKPEHRRVFRRHLRRALKGKKTYHERMDAVLRSLSGHQYELGFDEDTRLSKLKRFLVETKAGDCTEFSHTATLLARMAGIPARVVTGYVAARDLQTRAHRNGLVELRKRIDPLKEIPLGNLYLITTSHRHAWAQFYVPGYGWLDQETTAFAKPPKPSLDPNQRDVVIPLIERDRAPQPAAAKRRINWRAVAIVAGLVVAAFLLLLYLYRYGREIVLWIRSRRASPQGVEALYRLALVRLAARGYPLKEPFETPLEYAHRVPETDPLAEQLNLFRYRERLAAPERQELGRSMRRTYRGIWKQASSGTLGILGRVFSLRPLYY